MALAADIASIFQQMVIPPSGDQSAAENAKDDDWMCTELSKTIVSYFKSATIMASATVMGAVSAGTFAAGTGSASGWTIQDIKTQLLAGCQAKEDSAIANAWGSAVEGAGMAATCNFASVAGTCTPPPPSPPMPLAGPAIGTVAGAASGTCAPLFLAAFQTKTDAGIASGIASAITAFVASMQCLVTGSGPIAGAVGTGVTTPGA